MAEDVLNKKEIKELVILGAKIKMALECDINGIGLPCRSDRLASVEDMIEYIEIHNYSVTKQSTIKIIQNTLNLLDDMRTVLPVKKATILRREITQFLENETN